MHPLPGQPQDAGQPDLLAAMDELGSHHGGKFVPQRGVRTWFDRQAALRPAFASCVLDSLANRFHGGFPEQDREIKWDCERHGHNF